MGTAGIPADQVEPAIADRVDSLGVTSRSPTPVSLGPPGLMKAVPIRSAGLLARVRAKASLMVRPFGLSQSSGTRMFAHRTPEPGGSHSDHLIGAPTPFAWAVRSGPPRALALPVETGAAQTPAHATAATSTFFATPTTTNPHLRRRAPPGAPIFVSPICPTYPFGESGRQRDRVLEGLVGQNLGKGCHGPPLSRGRCRRAVMTPDLVLRSSRTPLAVADAKYKKVVRGHAFAADHERRSVIRSAAISARPCAAACATSGSRHAARSGAASASKQQAGRTTTRRRCRGTVGGLPRGAGQRPEAA